MSDNDPERYPRPFPWSRVFRFMPDAVGVVVLLAVIGLIVWLSLAGPLWHWSGEP